MKILTFVLFFLNSLVLLAQQASLSGVVKNSGGEFLPLANVLILPDSTIATAGNDGSFTVYTRKGRKEVIITYTGLETVHRRINLQADTVLTFVMTTKVSELREVTVNANRYSSEDIVQSTRTGTTTLTQLDINGIPVLGGEADLIKTLQLLPGTVRGVEGSSDLFVRGGAADQNLVLLDGAPIYNTSHLFGFLSVFNPSILDNVEAINGGFPAEYGGRLSSVLNISTNADLAERTKASGDIGLIASRIYVEQPLVKNKASFWIAGRRTYIDQVVRAIGEELPYFFYDINGKLILQPSSRNKLEFSFYDGEDILDIFRDRNNDGDGFLTSYVSGNTSQSFRWAHSFKSEWKSSLSLTRSAYRYNISNSFEENTLVALSDIEDYSAKTIFRKEHEGMNTAFQFGADWIRHSISPSIINTTGTISELLESSASRGKLAHELALHMQKEFPLSQAWLVNAGFRMSAGLVNGKKYFVPEPRLSMRYALSKDQSLKLSYSRMAQYMHRISNSAVTTPTDVWYTVTDEIAPQTSHQIAAAWQRFITRQKIFISAETYYKTMRDLIGYEEGTNLFFNTDFESKLIQGSGRAYGLEFLARKETGRFTGWISYTLSWSRRHFEEINDGQWFPSRYDRRHNGAIVTQYSIGKRWAASIVWEFISGARFTPVVGQYVILAPTLTGVDLIPLYSGINQVKLADSHRLDAGIKFMSKTGKKFQWQWFAGVYNSYNRASPVGMIIEQNEDDNSLRYLQPGLFGLLPFISYGFKF
ncbi:MAG: TonB-dependent receptor plug domain-containing protein [Cyclobacteriaceae bacterium]